MNPAESLEYYPNNEKGKILIDSILFFPYDLAT